VDQSTRVTLAEARRRVAVALGIEEQPWTPEEIKFFAAEWRIFAYELELVERYGDEIMEMVKVPFWVVFLRWFRAGSVSFGRDYKAGWSWWLFEAPFGARLTLAGMALFLMAYIVGAF
jgi:hypothetical protein